MSIFSPESEVISNGSQWESKLISLLPAPIRFLSVGVIGLTIDMGAFTFMNEVAVPVLLARLISLFFATLVTWRLNRALTFQATGRRRREEVLRYATVTAIAQGVSYGLFAILVSTVLVDLPLAAILVGAIIGTFCSYNGHRIFSFAPQLSSKAEV